MAWKMENAQFPGWGKNEKNDEEFEKDLDDLDSEMPVYIDLKNRYIASMLLLENTERELSEAEAKGDLSAQDRKTLTNTIQSQKEEMGELKGQILPLAERLSKLVTDSRFSDMRFMNKYDDGTVDDEDDENNDPAK